MNFKTLKTHARHPLIYGSSIVVIGGIVSNFFNFLFNLFMSRNLTISDFGTLASVTAFVTFPSLIVGAVTPLIIRFAGSYFSQGQLDKVRGLYIKIMKFLLPVGILVFILILSNISYLSNFFQIKEITILILADIIIFLGFLGVINMSLIQAKLAFGYQVLVALLGAVVKLLLGIIFIFMGFSTTSAVVAIVIASIITYIVSFFPIKFILDRNITMPDIDTKELFSYAIPSAITLIGLTSFISSDIILVKHFLSPHDAGMYSGLSLIGRVIFYISFPIGNVMFPIIVQKHSKNENITNTFKLSLFLVFAPSLLLTIFYYIFPKFTILFFLKKEEYLSLVPNLGFFALFISLYCLLFIISNFYLSIKKTTVFIPIILGAMFQIILINYFHQTFNQIITISLAISFLLVTGLLLYYPHATKKRL